MILTSNKVVKAFQTNFTSAQLRPRIEPGKVLMTTPDFFDIIDVKNPHMEGNAGKLSKELAKQQWGTLNSAYNQLVQRSVLEKVYEIKGAEGCEDMVFAANQSFPWLMESGEKVVIMSKMRHPSRQKEVIFFENFYRDLGYRIIHLKNSPLFEGMGDAIPLPGKQLVFGGYGHRSSPEAYEEIAEFLNVPIILLELTNPDFYHLDTCFVPLDEKTVLLHENAFRREDLEGLEKIFSKIITVPENEAKRGFALNAHVMNISGKKAAIIQQGNKNTVSLLKENGFEVKEIDTSEFIKSGGSVFCMKMMLY